MTTFFVYILYSRAVDKFYIGYTSDLDKRLDQHNHHVFKDSFTRRTK
ncbi:GIY-YIG nuclease family protein [Echinicola sediminis]